MRKLKLIPNSIKVQLGLRLFLATLAICMGNFLAVVLIMFFPIAHPISAMMGLTPEEIAEAEQKKLIAAIETKMKALVADASKENITKAALDAEIDKVNKMVEKLSNESIATLKTRMDELASSNEALQKELGTAKETLNAQGIELKKVTDKGVPGQDEAPKSFRQAVKDAFLANKDIILTEKDDDYGKRLSVKDYFEGKGKGSSTPTMTIKAAVDMLQSNIVGNYVNNIRLTELDAQRVGIPLAIYPHVMDVFSKKGITRPYMSLLVAYEYFNGVDVKVEGAASGKSSFKFKTVEFKAFFIATHFILSDETLDDLEEALDEISIVAPDKIQESIDGKIISAAGDDIADIKGILHADKSTAYVSVMGAASVEAAYIVDVIADAKLQAEAAKKRPNVVILNPTAIAALAAKKNTLEDSKSDKRVSYNNLGEATGVCGLAIVKNTDIAANACLVLDNKQPWIGVRKDMTMEIGYNGTDLTEGQKTIVMKIRIAFGVRDKTGVIYVSDITAAAAALATA